MGTNTDATGRSLRTVVLLLLDESDATCSDEQLAATIVKAMTSNPHRMAELKIVNTVNGYRAESIHRYGRLKSVYNSDMNWAKNNLTFEEAVFCLFINYYTRDDDGDVSRNNEDWLTHYDVLWIVISTIIITLAIATQMFNYG